MGPGGNKYYDGDIAIVGMSVRVPGAESLAQYWDNLRRGVESVRRLDRNALIAAGENPDLIDDPDYVPASAPLEGFAEFDADFFGFGPKEAAILDPQHRKFLETAWEAMEIAGHPPQSLGGRVGVFAGCGMGSYFNFNICSNPDLLEEVGMFLLRHTGNDKDFLATRASHIFDLNGPSVNIQTACSTSLVAVHYACKALRDGECDMALAGGATIELPQGRGYLYRENEILSPDGHCHAFDHRAQGTVFGSGAGAVALRRLDDALADGDHVWAIIKGSAINNDGAAKAGYLAPSVDGQAAAVRAALKAAGVSADTVDYVECHGTGTFLGDPIEVSALAQAFRGDTQATGFCRIGSVKTNIGHLDTAAGVAGLIKAALALHHRQIPPSLNFEAPNPAIDFAHSPFRVADRLTEWPAGSGPRRAGVNSLGVGGTNAHVILEEAPDRPASDAAEFPFHVLCLSARNKAALDANAKALAAHLRANPDLPLADVAWTLKEGRRAFEKRRVLVAETAAEAAALLESGDARRVFTHEIAGTRPEVVFMFPGGGAQYAGMARDLYETEPVFAEWMDRGLDHLAGRADLDLHALWLPEPGQEAQAEARLDRPSVQLPLIALVEYALAQLWISWGVRPAAMIGHSMGENVAACLAGVMSFEDCLDLVVLRGRLFDSVPAGGMLSIPLPVDEVKALVGDELDIASVNAPGLTAVSGPRDALERLSRRLDGDGVDHQRIRIGIAAHSRILDPILDDYRAFLRGIGLKAPQLPVISNRTGAELSAEQATDPDYWVEQLRRTVRFADGLATLGENPERVFLEVGPGHALSTLARMNPAVAPGRALATLRHPDEDIADDAFFLGVIGRLWACGVEADWTQIWGEARRHRLPLPTYAFQTRRYFIEPGRQDSPQKAAIPEREEDIARWGWRRAWKPRHADCDIDVERELDAELHDWLIFEDDAGIAADLADRLVQAGHRVSRVRAGDAFARLSEDLFTIAPEQAREGLEALFGELSSAGRLPDRIAHFWLVTERESWRPGSSFFDRNLEHGFHTLTALGQVLGGMDLPGPVHLTVVTSGAAQVRDESLPHPEKAMIAGPVGVIPREIPGVSCSSLDIELPRRPARGLFARPRDTDAPRAALTERLLEELMATPANVTAALRGERRFELVHRPEPLDTTADSAPFGGGGAWLITGGFGGIGLTIAADLVRRHGARAALLSRTPLPPRETWADQLETHAADDPICRRIRAMQQLESLGRGAVMDVAADVANIDRMREAVVRIEARLGPVTGVIHAAGHIEDGPLLSRTPDEIRRVFAPKVTGLKVLEELFPDGRLEQMILFSSTSTVTRPAGQVDYVAANEYLNAWARSRQGGKTRVCAINWGVWADTGMAAEAMERRLGTDSPERLPAGAPLLDEGGRDGRGNRFFVTRLDAAKHWVLDQHRTGAGVALMPGTGFLELAAEAMTETGKDGAFAIRDLYFFRPLDVADGTSREAVLRLKPDGEGLAFTVHGQMPGGYALCAQARLVPLAAAAQPAPVDPAAIRCRCPKVETADDESGLRSLQEAHLRFGPHWRVLRETARGDGEGLARLELPPALRGESEFRLHPGLMDIATGWAIRLAPSYDPSRLWVPVSYGEVRVFRPLEAEILSWVRLGEAGGSTDGFAEFDVTLTDTDGNVLVEIRRFRMKRLDGELDFTPPPRPDADAASLGLTGRRPDVPLSPEEKRLHRLVARGIRAEEGPEALRRALLRAAARSLPELIVSPLDLPGLIALADSAQAKPVQSGQSFDRPELDTDYVAPRNAVEETLAGCFEALLGLSRVGVEDSFFDLGGHSLIAVRLFARIKAAFGVDFPISVLFEAPTVAALARRIGPAAGGAEQQDRDGAQAPAGVARTDDFRHLVALHPGPGGDRAPIFIVAGMFGNVLNLRHLALLLGRDRPVFGLQARGLIGEDEPHRSIPEAAADYIAEMRRAGAKGPWLLGGFSGGGITAWEMARQLTEAGDEVALLAMLDTPLPVRPALSRRDKALIKIQEFRRKGAGYAGEWLRNRIAWELHKRRQGTRTTGAPDTDHGFNNRRIELAFREAVGRYDARPWNGPVTLFRPPLDRHWKVSGGRWVSAAREYVLHDNGWTSRAPDLEVVEVPGDHDSMVLEPHVTVLAEELRARLARSGADGGDKPNPGDDDANWHSRAAAE